MTTSFLTLVKRVAREDRGAALVEYAVLVGLITAAIIATIGLLGDQINTSFTNVVARLTAGNGANQ